MRLYHVYRTTCLVTYGFTNHSELYAACLHAYKRNLMHEVSDFRSDTVTKPTPEMYEAMVAAPLGDDVFGDDPTVIKLQEIAAEKLGKEASLFVPSGVMGNEIAVGILTRPGDEVICENQCHIFDYETGALAALNGVQVRPLPGVKGMLKLADVLRAVQDPESYHPRTGLVSLENTHNMAGGKILPQDEVIEMGRVVHDIGLPFHLDGARLANAAVATNKSMAELAEPFDTVMITLSKSLGSPIGSIVAGSEGFITEAHRMRKMLGGGMRQVGILAACGIISLEKMVDRLAEDHENCQKLGKGLSEINGIEADLSSADTNMLFFKVEIGNRDPEDVRQALEKRGVLALYLTPTIWRMVTHYDVDADDVDKAIRAWSDVLTE